MNERWFRQLVAAAFAASVVHTVRVEGQRAPTEMRLAPESERVTAEFSIITSIRELGDGRVLVTDSREMRVMLADFKAGSAAVVGRQGRGPNEYTGTGLLFALAGDSSVMLDLNRRWILFHHGDIVGEVPSDAPIVRAAGNFIHGTDTSGSVLTMRVGSARNSPRTEAQDSLLLVLVRRSTAVAETIGIVRSVPSDSRTVAQPGGGTITTRIFKPFATGEVAKQFADGWTAIVRLDPYRVDWITPGRRIVRGAPLPNAARTIGEVDRTAFQIENTRPGRPPNYAFDAFPTNAPPFEYRAPGDPPLFAAPDGRLVIRRTILASASENAYDVVDRSGRLVSTLLIPKRDRVVGFGAASVYIVSRDADDIERIRRHSWP
jgi:hypothetical protein